MSSFFHFAAPGFGCPCSRLWPFRATGSKEARGGARLRYGQIQAYVETWEFLVDVIIGAPIGPQWTDRYAG